MHSHSEPTRSGSHQSVVMEPGEAAVLPDSQGNIADEIPPHIASEMMSMIQQLKVRYEKPASVGKRLTADIYISSYL